MATSDFIDARYGDDPSRYLSQDHRRRCEARQIDLWRALRRITQTKAEEPWTEDLHSPRALPAFMGLSSASPGLVWDAGLGTLFDHLSFPMPYDQATPVIEAILRRVAAVRCVMAGQEEQASAQTASATELLRRTPIDRAYQERVDAEDQFEVFLLTELQERFALAHELGHYLKAADEGSFKAFAERVKEQARTFPFTTFQGTLREVGLTPSGPHNMDLYEVGLDPYAWYLKSGGQAPASHLDWPSLIEETQHALVILGRLPESEREEVICDLLGALSVVLAAHDRRSSGWSAHMAVACSTLALCNLGLLLDLDAWVSAEGNTDLDLTCLSASSRQRCLYGFLPVVLPFLVVQGESDFVLTESDAHTVMHLAGDRFRRRIGSRVSNLDWLDTDRYTAAVDPEVVLLLAGFMPLRADLDHRAVNRTAGGHRFDLGNIDLSDNTYARYRDDPDFRDELDEALRRHHRGDWGDIPAEDWRSNDEGLFEEFAPPIAARVRRRDKLWSTYVVGGESLLITTSRDRTRTEVMFWREY